MARPPDPLARIKLLAAAEAEFVEHGVEGAKIENITRRAGISKGAFYLHFPSKRDLFRELVESFLARLAALTDSGLQHYQPDGSCHPAEAIDRWVSLDVEIFEFLWQNRGLHRLLLEGGPGAQFRYLVDDFLERLVAKARHVIEECTRLGFYRSDLDADLAADLIAGAYERLARKALRETSRPTFRPQLERVQELLLFGLASPALTETWKAARQPTALDSPSGDATPPSRVRATASLPAADDAVPASSNALRGVSKGRR